MRSKPVAALLADLSVTKSHSRPHVCDDNPYSESHFKTMKYQDDFPARFGCIEDARAYCQTFFPWYNMEHRHSGIGYPIGIADEKQGEGINIFIFKNYPTLSEVKVNVYCKPHCTGYQRSRYIEFPDDLPKTNVGKSSGASCVRLPEN